MEDLLSATVYGAGRVIAIWGTAIAFLTAFLRIRSQGMWKSLKSFDEYVRRINDALNIRPHYPGDSYPNYIPDGEKAFYEEFSRQLSKAENVIFNSGDGFNLALRAAPGGEPRSGDKADVLDVAIICALDSNPNLVYKRFQITSACSLNWISRLIYMKERFGERFRVLINPGYDHLGCFCAIDPERYGCVFEWQILSGRHYFYGNPTKGYGFTYTNQKICQKLEDIFSEIEHASDDVTADDLRGFQKELWEERARKILTEADYKPADPEIIAAFEERQSAMDFREADFPKSPPAWTNRRLGRWEVPMNSELYFAFGSNMDRDQMKKRTPLAEYIGIGYIPNHDLVFNRKGSYRPGGVASIVPKQGVSAYGVIWAISSDELREMDRIEDPQAYERVQKTVVRESRKKEKVLCNVYVAFPQGDIPPDQQYLELIIRAAESAGLPAHWVEGIKRYRGGGANDTQEN